MHMRPPPFIPPSQSHPDHISNTDTHLSQVELSGVLGVNTLELDQRGVGSGVSLSSLVSEHTTFDVETVILSGLCVQWR